METLEIASMHKIALSILRSDDLKYLIHIKQNTIVRCRTVVVLMVSQPMFDL